MKREQEHEVEPAMPTASDPEAAGEFARLWAEHGGTVARHVQRHAARGGLEHEAEDIVQEVCVAAWRAVLQGQPVGDYARWLLRVASNTLSTFGRRRRRVPHPFSQLAAGEVAGAVEQAAPAKDPSEILHHHELLAAALEALAGLTETQREALFLVTAQGASYAEAAALLGIPVNTLKSRVHDARRRLTDRLRQKGLPGLEEDGDDT